MRLNDTDLQNLGQAFRTMVSLRSIDLNVSKELFDEDMEVKIFLKVLSLFLVEEVYESGNG